MGSSRKTFTTSRIQGAADLQVPVNASLDRRFIPSSDLLKLDIPIAGRPDLCGAIPFPDWPASRPDSVNGIKNMTEGPDGDG